MYSYIYKKTKILSGRREKLIKDSCEYEEKIDRPDRVDPKLDISKGSQFGMPDRADR
jgi:hypothetical protein